MTTDYDNPYLTAALAALHAGVCVVPPRQNGTKRPIGAWKLFQDERPDEATLRQWYANERTGVGVVAGAVSGGLELFEFDEPGIARSFIDAAEAAGMEALCARIVAGYAELTPGGGVHWFYRCTATDRNTKLARRPDPTPDNPLGVKVLIETRGEGGFAIVAPSNGAVHPSGGAYVLHSGGWASVATITPEEREALFDLARSFDQMPRRSTTEHFDSKDRVVAGDRPGDRYAAVTSWAEVLEPHGWRFVHETDGVGYWRRPGKAWGISASTNYGGADLLYVFSTSTVFEPEQSYTKFGAYTVLNHGGDYAAAGRALLAAQPGGALVTHGGKTEEVLDAVRAAQQAATPADVFSVLSARLLRTMDLPPIEWVWEGRVPRGRYVVLSGESGIGKSWFILAWCLCSSRAQPFLGLETAPVRVLYIDEENGVQEAQRRLRALADGMGIPADEEIPIYFLIDEGIKIGRPKDLAKLIATIEAYEITAIVSDSLIRVFTGNENSSEDVEQFHALVDYVRRQTAVTWWMLQHLNKAGKDGGLITPGDRLRGSGDFKGHADVHIQLRGADTTGTTIVHVEKLRGGTTPTNIVYRLEGDTAEAEPVVLKMLGEAAAALGAIRATAMEACSTLEVAGTLTVGELIDALGRLGIPARTAKRGIADARKAGLILVDRKEGMRVFLRLRTENDPSPPTYGS